MKRTVVRVCLLVATFIIGATISVILAAHLTAPQQSVVQQCRAKCTDDFQTCFKLTKGKPAEREKCYTQQRQCREKCEPSRSPGE